MAFNPNYLHKALHSGTKNVLAQIFFGILGLELKVFK